MLGLPLPGAAYGYIDQVLDKFILYVESEILPKINTDELTPAQILTGLQFILVNELPDYEKAVLELLTIRHVGDQATEIYESALRVAEFYGIATCVLVRVLVESMLADDHSQRDPLYTTALLEMGEEATLVMLDMLQPHRKKGEREELVKLIQVVSGVKAPQPWPEWLRLDPDQLAKLKQQWEELIYPDRRIREALKDPNNPCGDRVNDEQEEQLAKLPPTEPDNGGVPGDNVGATEEIGPDAEDGGENPERVDKPKAGELEGGSREVQTTSPSAPPKPIAQPKPMKSPLLDWSAYTPPVWILLGGIAVSLIGMISVIARHRGARRRRIQNWNPWSRT